MHRSIVVCVILNGNVKRCIGCDISGTITLCVKFDGMLVHLSWALDGLYNEQK
jgi:hypothetical protein